MEYNLNGILLTIGAKKSRFTWEVDFLGQQFHSGYSVELLRDLQLLLNFTIHPFLIDDESISHNGSSISRAIYIMSKGFADILISHVVPASELAQHNLSYAKKVQILHPTYAETSMSAIYQQPKLDRIKNVYLLPFTPSLWISYFLTLILIHSLHLLIHPKPLRNVLLEIFGNVSLQGIGDSGDRFFGKVIFWIGSIFSTFLFWMYSASIFSIITQSRIPVQKISDLIQYGFIFVTHEKSFAGMIVLKELIKDYGLDQGIVSTNTESEVEILIDKPNTLLSHWELFYGVASNHNNFTDHDICKMFSKLEGIERKLEHVWIVKKGFPYKNAFNIKLAVLRESGLAFRYMQHSSFSNFHCLNENEVSFSSVSTNEAFFAFLISLIGLGLSGWIYCAEILIAYVSNKERQ